MSDSPFVPFYTSDFLAGTSGMTAATKGVYITLLSLMYEAEAPLPQSWETLARRCGCTKSSFRKAIETLEDDAKIHVTDAGIWSEKCDKHIAQRRERSDSAKAAAKKRWEKEQQKQGSADTTASSAQCKPEPYPEPKSKRDTNVSPKKTHGTRLPDDWSLPKAWGDWAVSEGYPESSVRDQADRFKDYWIGATGQKATKRDWLATWRNWCRNNLSKTTKGSRNERPRTAQERAAANHSDVASAWLAEGRRRDQERGIGGGEADSGDPGEFGMDSGQASDAVVSLFPAGSGHDGFGGGGFGLDEHPRQISAGSHRDGL